MNESRFSDFVLDTASEFSASRCDACHVSNCDDHSGRERLPAVSKDKPVYHNWKMYSRHTLILAILQTPTLTVGTHRYDLASISYSDNDTVIILIVKVRIKNAK